MAALLIRTSRRPPYSLPISAPQRATSVSDVTSSATALTRSPPSACAAAAPRPGSREPSSTVNPCARSWRAHSSPRPRLAPVTRASGGSVPLITASRGSASVPRREPGDPGQVEVAVLVDDLQREADDPPAGAAVHEPHVVEAGDDPGVAARRTGDAVVGPHRGAAQNRALAFGRDERAGEVLRGVESPAEGAPAADLLVARHGRRRRAEERAVVDVDVVRERVANGLPVAQVDGVQHVREDAAHRFADAHPRPSFRNASVAATAVRTCAG